MANVLGFKKTYIFALRQLADLLTSEKDYRCWIRLKYTRANYGTRICLFIAQGPIRNSLFQYSTANKVIHLTHSTESMQRANK